MFQADNFISFHDLTPEAHYLWASPTIYDVLGYEPEEVVGMRAYNYIFSDDIADSRTAHKENLINDLVASQIVLRYKDKDNRPVYCACVFSLCYDFIVNCATMLDPGAEAYVQLRAHSSAMTRLVGSKKEEFERMKRHHEAFTANTWNHKVMEPEARVCLIINRFSRNLIVMYASSACEKVFHMDPDQITGKPILLFLRSDDLASFVEQVDIIKTSTAITQMRFWFQSLNWPQEIPCEAIIFGSADGIVAVVRRCKPFVRKHYIGSREQFGAGAWSDSFSSDYIQSYGSSSSSLASSISASPLSPSFGSYCSKSPSHPRNVSRNASRATLNRIRILDLAYEKARPLTILPEDDPRLIHEGIAAEEIPGFKELISQDYEEADDEDDIDFVNLAISKQENRKDFDK
ncbi:hypothetical protein BGZ65_003015 [Modicella reniformis]|uniref:PAS domain-containing protein n=1 Tax=Modicella reniformis TaxID=1440133 RepID=A0A9P6M9G4_9FUNG|nr:hypothetical protein BGZ65_003015 [Modicella reniformis]